MSFYSKYTTAFVVPTVNDKFEYFKRMMNALDARQIYYTHDIDSLTITAKDTTFYFYSPDEQRVIKKTGIGKKDYCFIIDNGEIDDDFINLFTEAEHMVYTNPRDAFGSQFTHALNQTKPLMIERKK